MTSTQRVIKYCAIAFAAFLIVNICSGLIWGLSSVSNLFYTTDIKEEMKNLDISVAANVLDITLKATNLEIKTGDELKAETNNKYITIKQENNKLIINEKRHNNLSNKDIDLVIYIPVDMIFDIVMIEVGAGKVEIDTINAEKLGLDLGAGNVTINSLNVSHDTDIEAGVGKFEIKAGVINDLDLNLGVGNSVITAKILGESDIETGVGSATIKLIGTQDDYKIKVEKGIGSVTINKVGVADESVYATGINEIDIDGGIGSVKVDFESIR